MAVSRVSSNNPDWQDVVVVMEAFQQINQCTIVLTGRVEGVHDVPMLQFLVEAHDSRYEIGEASTLAWVKCLVGSGGHKTTEAAIMWALYQLDWKLAEQTLERTKKTA